MMKAIVWTRYGSPDGLQLREVATPEPKDNEVLITSLTTPKKTSPKMVRRMMPY